MSTMPVFYGLARKMALVPINLFLIGWIAYLIGFVWDLIDNFEKGPKLYDLYATAVGGLILYFCAMLHTGLPGLPSKIVGSITACLSVIYFVAAGSVLYKSGHKIYLEGGSVDVKNTCLFVGVLIASFCWTLTQIFSLFYKYKQDSQDDVYVRLYNESTDRISPRNASAIFAGIARKLVIPMIVFSAVGWCVYIVGVHKLLEVYQFPTDINVWGANIFTILLFLAALMHAGCSGGASQVMGISSALLSMLFLIFMGSVIYENGYQIYSICREQRLNCSILHSSVPISILYQFSGGVGCCFFWATVLALWPFYKQMDTHTHSGHVQRSTLTSSYRQDNDESLPLFSRR